MDAHHLLTITRSTLDAVQYCFIITVGEGGRPNARIVQHHKPQNDDLVLWFGTSRASRKAADVRRDSRVTVAFQHDPEIAYVVLHGQAELVDDPELRQHYWLKEWTPFFPGGPTGDDFILIRFVPAHIELMNFNREITPAPFGLQHADLKRVRDVWVVDYEHTEGEPT